MAKSTSRPPRKPTPIDASTPFDAPVADTSAADAPPPEQIPQERPATPKNSSTTKVPTFIQTMNSVPKGDWGPRANIYLYRVEPVIDRTRSGDSKFINVYAEPIGEDRVMADYGSGRYKLILNFRKPGAETGDVIDSTYMDILNMKYPPKIPLGEWTDDPRNKKWAWAKEANGIPAAAVPVAAPLDPLSAFGTFMDIQDRIEDRMKPAENTATSTAAVDPWSAAEKILNMRSENPMVAILQEQMKASTAAAEAERDRAFKAAESAREREFKLQEKLLEARTSAPTKGLLEQLVELAGPTDKSDIFKRVIGTVLGTGEPGPARAGRTTALDITRDIATKFLESPLANGVGQWLASVAQRNAGPAPPMNGGPPIQQQPADDFGAFLQNVLNPALLRHYIQGFSGADFAGWLFDGYPDRVAQFQNFTHPRLPGLQGAAAIIQAYKNTADMWPTLNSRGEPAFVQFVNEFCHWKPDSEPIDAEVIEPAGDAGEQGEEGPERI